MRNVLPSKTAYTGTEGKVLFISKSFQSSCDGLIHRGLHAVKKGPSTGAMTMFRQSRIEVGRPGIEYRLGFLLGIIYLFKPQCCGL